VIFRFYTILFIITILIANPLRGQHDIDFYADVMISASDEENRVVAAKEFESLLIPKLKSDSLFNRVLGWKAAPILYPADSSFRIITWTVPSQNPEIEDGANIRGVIQYAGIKELQFLSDQSQFERSNETMVLPPHRWIGALYKDIYPLPNQDSLYLVYGINPYDTYRMLHILEVLDLRGGQIRFGYPAWENKDSTISVRKIYEVARGSSFDPQIHPKAERLVLDHLRNIPYNPGTAVRVNVPDGTYIFFDWGNGKYRYNDRLFSDEQDRVIRNPKLRKEAAKRDLFGNPRD